MESTNDPYLWSHPGSLAVRSDDLFSRGDPLLADPRQRYGVTLILAPGIELCGLLCRRAGDEEGDHLPWPAPRCRTGSLPRRACWGSRTRRERSSGTVVGNGRRDRLLPPITPVLAGAGAPLIVTLP